MSSPSLGPDANNPLAETSQSMPAAPQYEAASQPPANSTQATKAAKPFYKKWWFIAIIVVVILGLASMCGGGDKAADSPTATESAAPASTPSEQETAVATITMPDVTGQKGDAAKKAIEDAGITSLVTMTDVDGEDSVWNPANWSVVSQEPAAGTEVAADVEVTLMVNHDSEDEAAAQASQAEADAKAAGEMNSQGLRDGEAAYWCGETWEKALQKEYPALKVKAHSIMGVMVNELGSDDRFFIKETVSVGEADYTAECYVGGTDDNPEVELGQYY
ncbi:PASTA domain-containing protein [Actinomyces urogenitalis]|uniref:PASTA domain-containing protein n=1 Tax=Actinomyces urogenitalis TaxID=103621 RepID=UPI00290248D7|nr:PASTA domain-containing protein [Actinomyces urogenitalis]MDU0864915.1 PASTA domain-containing protein [Actinomyces urogenitalis]MDU0874284.1 PASTA domain-containing protein [Actinomyces urogenitalis]MDU1564901.1 PASTA domain-containing protein [Actinomyces urogenitalis]MDU1639912.1 PASTA domain-containing protein [Actinomyces urogenitalis]MDU5427958.1 PASTA domain-containing protein [Actinomyces urogenitalis]